MTLANELSFLPDGYLSRKGGRRALVIGVSLILAVSVTLALQAARVQRSVAELESRDASVSAAHASAARKLEPQINSSAQQRGIIQHAALAAALIECVPRSNILAGLTNALPAGGSLLDITLDATPHVESPATSSSPFDMRRATLEAKRQAEQLPAPTPPSVDVTIRITGLAESDWDVAQYLAGLTASPLFADVNLVISEACATAGGKPAGGRRFQIQLALKPQGQLKLPIHPASTTAADLLD